MRCAARGIGIAIDAVQSRMSVATGNSIGVGRGSGEQPVVRRTA
jgi:hypothetical protein